MRLGLLLFVCCLPLSSYAESTDDYGRMRLKHAYWMGPAVTTGHLDATADNAKTTIRLTSLAGIRLGAEVWPEETMGVLLSGEVGMPAQIKNVLGNEVRFTRHRFAMGLTFRHFMGPRPTAPAFFISSQMSAVIEDVQEQQPAVLVSRFTLSPNLRFGYERFVRGDTTWLRVGAAIGYPFFVRETPSDSGRPDSMYDARASVSICHYVSQRWGLQFGIEHLLQSFQHGGEATRAGGVNDVSVFDSYTSAFLTARYIPAP